ncbi:LLM class flavin-dependent oxidoreductase [Portibacter lacus]|uniref:Oxidoreductase n=1 Tax=Portibacter lacus TaxID=1099794 RepID=A0AA37WF54_9BACT|nr:LLM class flavin-dependent oxidoreductase [Portibacter lacus]GLR17399.1 oxidoreductase [Portibacter lacus]
MELGIDSFAAVPSENKSYEASKNVTAINELLERIVVADQAGVDVFGIGEHHRKEFLDSAPTLILAAAAAKTKNIRLASAVTVLSASDPVRVFQNFSTLDLISNGRAEIVAGRGSFIESFPLFGFNLQDYDELFSEKLDLLLKIRAHEQITWKGQFRAPLNDQAIYPRPIQAKLPIWLGVGGTPASFARAGSLGLPLMVAVIGGETHRFRPLVDLYRDAGRKAGFAPDALSVGLHSFGYVAGSKAGAINDFYPGYEKMMNKIGKERGWAQMSKERFIPQIDTLGAIVLGSPEEVAEKIIRHSNALGGISRFTFQMDVGLSHDQLLNSIELIGQKVKPIVNEMETQV